MNSRPLFSSLVAFACAGCAITTPTPSVVAPDATAAQFGARSLDDRALRQFLNENLSGASGDIWDFEKLAWAAFYYQPTLAFARAQWATSRASRDTTAARPNPTLSIAPGFNTNHDAGVSPWFPAINFDFLLQGDKRARQVDIAQAEAEVARLTVLAAAWQTRSDVRHALTDLHAATDRAQMLRQQSVVQTELETLLQQRLSLGRATATEVAAARIARQRTEASEADATAQAAAARARLASAIGVPLAALDGKKFLPSEPVPLSTEALALAREESLRSRADVLAALAKIRSARAALELEGAKQKPDIHLGPGYQWDQGANKWSLALTFELPLFHHNEGPIAEALARHGEAAAQLIAIQAKVIAEVDAAMHAVSSARAQVDLAHLIRAEAEAQVARAGERVALGAADQVERATARLELAAALGSELDASIAALVAAGQLEDALQLPFPRLAVLADPAHPSLTRTP